MVVHGGEKLLSMDDDGFSDPYCIIAADREKVRYIKSTECTDYVLKTLYDDSTYHCIFLDKNHSSRLGICQSCVGICGGIPRQRLYKGEKNAIRYLTVNN